MVLAHHEKPAAIVLEVGLPGTVGWDLLTALKRDADMTCIPVVLCSWLEDEDLGLGQGANVYLRKLVLFEHFLEALSMVGIGPSVDEL